MAKTKAKDPKLVVTSFYLTKTYMKFLDLNAYTYYLNRSNMIDKILGIYFNYLEGKPQINQVTTKNSKYISFEQCVNETIAETVFISFNISMENKLKFKKYSHKIYNSASDGMRYAIFYYWGLVKSAYSDEISEIKRKKASKLTGLPEGITLNNKLNKSRGITQ